MKRFFIVILSFLMLFPLMAEEDFFELCKTGTALQISAAIKAGASINDRTDDGATPLICAAFNSNPEVITTLLKAGADATTKSNRNKTAFDYAKENEDLKGTSAYWELNNARF